MSLFLSDRLILDPAYLVSATAYTGEGALDGVYDLCCLLDVNGKPKQVYASYATSTARDAAFAALVTHLRMPEHGALLLDLDEEGL